MTTASYILTGKAIFDSKSDESFEGFVAVKDNKIVKIGKTGDSYEDFVDDSTVVIDCADKLIMPGMIDAHMHFFDGIFQNSRFMCRDLFSCKSAKECVEVIDKFAKAHPDYRTITGMGWFIPQWEDQTLPDKYMLDEIEPDRPVYLMCADGHSFWLNSKALEESEVDPDRKLLFGEIEKAPDGSANGVMHELDACGPCTVNAQKLPPEERKALIKDFVDVLIRKGFTSTTDMAVLPKPLPLTDDVRAVAEMEASGDFNFRLNLYPSLGVTDDFSIVEEYGKLFSSDKLRMPGLKAFVDGVHGNHTALQKEPYLDMPDHKGESFYSHEHYLAQVAAANKAGYGVKLHCCGEGATEWALDAFEYSAEVNGDTGVRNSIEHVEVLRPEEDKRFTDLKVTAAVQPLHLMYEGPLLYNVLGEDRAQYQYSLKRMIENGVNVAFSSDFPVADFDPMLNIYFSVTRCNLEGNPVEENSTQCISVAQALRAYTYGGAYCVNMEDQIGTLEEGKLADIVVLDRNICDVSPAEILKTKVVLTMIDGIISYNQLFN